MAFFGIAHHSARSLAGTFDPAQINEFAILFAVSTAAAYLANLAKVPGGADE